MRFLLIVSGVLDFFFICFFLILTITRKKSAVGDHKLPLFSPQFKQTNLVSSSPSIGPCEHELEGACDEGVGVEGETFSHFTAEQLFFLGFRTRKSRSEYFPLLFLRFCYLATNLI